MTADEKKEIKQAVLDEIKAESNDITEIETVSTLDGLTGLPAMQGGKLVTAPLSLLSKPATDAAATANAAAGTANKAADTANKAAQTATNAAATANKAASMISTYDDRINLAMNGASARFDGFVEGVVVERMSVTSVDGIYYDKTNKRFCAKKGDRYYNNWAIGNDVNAASMYLDDGRKTPRKDKVYVCGTCLYVWNDKEDDLVVVDKTTKELGTWLITHENVTTIDALNQELDAFDAKTAQGLHHVKCWGIPLLVTFANLNVSDNVLMQTITGSLTTNAEGTALATINAPGHYTTLVRYYQEGKWGIWASIGDSISASINVSQLDTYFMKEDGKGGVVVDMVKCKNAKPIYVVVDDEGNRVGLLFTHSDTMKHCLVLNFLTHITLGDDGSLITSEHKHTYDYPKFYRKNLGFKFFSNAGESDPSYFEKLQASKWYCPLDEQFKRMVPTLQGGAAGDGKKYIYSQGGSDNTRTVLSSKMWIYKHSDFNLFLRFKHWGANNDKAEENYSQVQLPNAWTGSNGLMRRDIYARLDAFELREQNSTATEVRIVTPIFTTGGTRELSISQATTAKAGVMTAADKAQLDVIAASMDSFGNSITEQAKRIYDLEQCKPLATKSRNGFMSSEDKTQLQGAFADFNARQRANDVEGYVGKSNVISVPGDVRNTQIAADIYRNAEERDYTPGASFGVYISAGYDENNPNKQCVWFGFPIEATKFVRYRLDYWLHGTADTLVGKYLCDTNDKYYAVREGAVGEYISEASDDTPCIMTIADRRLLNKIKQKLGL